MPVGSSPRMRGTPVGIDVGCEGRGIIPAYAGNTEPSSNFGRSIWDHPRVCGEHGRIVTINGNVKGSSPRMRGTHAGLVDFLDLLGIIPAYAGNTTIFCHTISSHRDHPRVCGEHLARGVARRALIGSSPRMRGTQPSCFSATRDDGIIPAYAGNTEYERSLCPMCGDHPRVCGEHWSRDRPNG